MAAQVRLGGKSLGATQTIEGSQSRVGRGVTFQVTLLRERFVTNSATKGLFAGWLHHHQRGGGGGCIVGGSGAGRTSFAQRDGDGLKLDILSSADVLRHRLSGILNQLMLLGLLLLLNWWGWLRLRRLR